MSKRKFNIWQISELFAPKRKEVRNDIHSQLAETIIERKKILKEWEKLFLPKAIAVKKDIHDQLQETIAKLKRERQIWMTAKSAA